MLSDFPLTLFYTSTSKSKFSTTLSVVEFNIYIYFSNDLILVLSCICTFMAASVSELLFIYSLAIWVLFCELPLHKSCQFFCYSVFPPSLISKTFFSCAHIANTLPQYVICLLVSFIVFCITSFYINIVIFIHLFLLICAFEKNLPQPEDLSHIILHFFLKFKGFSF